MSKAEPTKPTIAKTRPRIPRGEVGREQQQGKVTTDVALSRATGQPAVRSASHAETPPDGGTHPVGCGDARFKGAKGKATLSPPVCTGSTPTRSETQSTGGQKERVAMRSVGLDLGKKEVSFCEVRDGKVIARRTARGMPDLDELLGPTSAPATVAIEACREAWHVHDVLTANGHRVLIIDTTRVKRLGVGQHGRKTDRVDAEAIARAVEERRIPLAHVLSPHRRALREKLNVRRGLIETRASFITAIRGIVRARGEKLGASDTDYFRRNLAGAKLTDAARAAVAPLAATLDALDEQLSRVESELEELAATEPTLANLTTAPGTNLVVAAVFVSVIDDAKRFTNAHRVESYLGLVPREKTTGGSDNRKLGAITKCGNPYVRAMLIQAAWCILRRRRAEDPLAIWGRLVAARRGKCIAVVALARRLAGILWAMWRDGLPYDARRLATASVRGLARAAWTAENQADAMRVIARKAAVRANSIRIRTVTLAASSARQEVNT